MILLTGGTGALGARVMEGLVSCKYPTRVFTRGGSDWRDVSIPRIRQLGLDAFLGDLCDSNKLAKALEGCTVVINLSGTMRSRPEQSFEEIHVKAVSELVRLAELQGIQRFIHVSCLGASKNSESEYFRTKYKGEQIVEAGKFYWTIFRPSFMFGRKFALLDLMMPLIRPLPVLPLIGGGLNEFQPICEDDVASCILQSIYHQGTANKKYDLAGPRVYTLAELLKHVNDSLVKPKPTVSVSSSLCLKLAQAAEMIYPQIPLTQELLHLITSDSTADTTLMQQTFAVKMTALDDHLQQLID